jgi:DNA ligase (NAD+)
MTPALTEWSIEDYHPTMEKNDRFSKRVAELVEQISMHQALYYNEEPVISDEDFDALWNELLTLDPDNPVLKKIGRDVSDGWPKARHVIPMGSQSKASTPEEFLSWAKKMPFTTFIVQDKLDGASIELQYQDGNFIKAVTRGDGIIGDDITRNARMMQGLVPKMPEKFTGGVRGEVLMSRKVHAEKYKDKANCRNAANGLMKRKDGTGSKDLTILCYDARGRVSSTIQGSLFDIADSGTGASPFENEITKLTWLASCGFNLVRYVILDTWNRVIEYRAQVMADRPNLTYDIDGLVVKGLAIDEKDLDKPRPEKQIAFKFNPEEAVTTLKSVEWSESGSLYTPIGIVEPVRLAGTTVQRANLCNPSMIRDMNLKIGSKVVITKRGEIIPKIETMIENPADTEEIEVPSRCSACGSELVDEGTRLFCPNELCSKKELHRIEKWLSILDIQDFGPAIILRLHSLGKVKNVADLYDLTWEEVAAIERMGETLAKKILRNLHEVKEVELADFIAGFDIDGVGALIARKMIDGGFDTLETLYKADIADLVAIHGIGEKLAAAFTKGLAAVKKEMDVVLSKGNIKIIDPRQKTQLSEQKKPFWGKNVCFTGELNTMSRTQAAARIKSQGGIVKPSVSSDLDYLITNDATSGSSKSKKAITLGIAIISEAEMLEMLDR